MRAPVFVGPAGLAACGAAVAIGNVPPLGAAAWLGAGAALLLSTRPGPRVPGVTIESLERHVMRCRRRGESASVMVAHVPDTGRGQAERLSSFFRLTDSVVVARIPHGYEVAAVLDDDALDRDALEKRLRGVAAASATAIAWKRFPDDGVTLSVLIEAARATLADSTAIEPATIVAPVLEGPTAARPAEGK
ncbi:MAG TPA: hypothetical protein VJU60_01200 [Thermoleophilaceae bacterium]|nr:hypothetical protein [Thermoleophilaceae bacterium]